MIASKPGPRLHELSAVHALLRDTPESRFRADASALWPREYLTSTSVPIILLSILIRFGSSMAAMLIENAASIKIMCQSRSSQLPTVSARPVDPVILSRVLRGRSGASLLVQRLTLTSLRCSNKL